jgi:4-amino-4-deoxy-L-arabinose transferase-like glycosyltransferase
MAESPTEKSSEEPKEPPSDPKAASSEAKASRRLSDEKAEPKDAEEKAEASKSKEAGLVPVSAADQAAPSEPVVEPKKPEKAEKEEGERLLVPGNPLRWKRGGITAFVGGFFAFLLMANTGQLRLGVPLGFVCMLVATWGVLDLAGTFDDAVEPAGKIDAGLLVRALLGVVGAGLLFCAALIGGQSGTLHQWVWGGIVTLTFELLVYSVFNLGARIGPWAKDEAGLPRPIWKRHGFWLVTVAALLYLPTLGSYGLWDPWETHYGEVSREILARDDWISLWWAQDGWFWSKPILNFWIQALAMASLGTHYMPDQMLVGADGLASAHPEWVVRTPNFLLTVLGMYLLYKAVARVFGRRAGLLGGIVLATMPDWYFLAHQTMTDMPFVAPMCGAMGLLMLGLATDENAKARTWELDAFGQKWKISAWHLVFGAIALVTLPQIIYLLSRNVSLGFHGDKKGFDWHWDEFRSGSGGGNCGLPGNEACNLTHPASIPKAAGIHPDTFGGVLLRLFGAFEPVMQAIVWSAVLGTLIYLNWGERRVRRLYYIAAWFLAAIATMGKGPAGFGLPVLVGLAYVATTKRWSELTRFELISGLLVIAAVAIPWYVAMYVRHGSPFTDRLIFHDMFNRAFHHVHDTNEGDDTSFRFYVWQLGYALFPWVGLAPLGLLWWMRKTDTAEKDGKATANLATNDVSIMLVMWFIFAFALFSFMGTKFHHYIFPAVPAVAMLIGIVLNDMLGRNDTSSPRFAFVGVAFGGIITALVILVSWKADGSIWGDKGKVFASTDKILLGIACVTVPLALVATRFFSKPAIVALPEEAPEQAEDPSVPYRGAVVKDDERVAERERVRMHERLMWSASAIAGAFVVLLVGRDLSSKPEGADQPGAIHLLHLFTYNYRRPWPDSLDFNAVLAAFAIVAAVCFTLLSVERIRRWAVLAMCALATVWALWGIDVYMIRTSPHWGQHEITEAYYRARTGPEEPLIAYQMNWKGENFYTGNKIPAYVSSGAPFTQWVKQQKEKGTKVMFFVTEHSRVGGLKGEVQGHNYKEITDKELDNKFVIVRAEL